MSRITLSMILLLAANTIFAQSIILPQQLGMFMKKQQPTAKTNSQAYRLIAETNLEDDGSGIEFADSTRYVYKSNNNENIDSSYTYQWVGSTWEPQSLVTTEYNAQGWPVKLKGFYFAGPGWEQESRAAGTYDANGNALTMVYEEYNGISWDTTLKYTNTYANNKLTEETVYADQGAGLQPVIRTKYHYNGQGLEDTVETQMYFGGWLGSEKDVYTYSAAGMVLTHVNYTGDFSGGWEFTSKNTFTYNLRDHLIEEVLQEWNGASWQNFSKTGYQVTALGHVSDYLVERWNGTDYDEDIQVLYFRDFYKPELIDSMVEQHKMGNSWINASSEANLYDGNGNHTRNMQYAWGNNSWTLESESRKYYEAYNAPTGIGNQSEKLQSLSVYPNPVESVAIFSFVAEHEGMAALAIYDLAGRQVFAIGAQASVGQNVLHWDAGSLPSGSYLYKLNVNGKVANGVLVK